MYKNTQVTSNALYRKHFKRKGRLKRNFSHCYAEPFTVQSWSLPSPFAFTAEILQPTVSSSGTEIPVGLCKRIKRLNRAHNRIRSDVKLQRDRICARFYSRFYLSKRSLIEVHATNVFLVKMLCILADGSIVAISAQKSVCYSAFELLRSEDKFNML